MPVVALLLAVVLVRVVVVSVMTLQVVNLLPPLTERFGVLYTRPNVVQLLALVVVVALVCGRQLSRRVSARVWRRLDSAARKDLVRTSVRAGSAWAAGLIVTSLLLATLVQGTSSLHGMSVLVVSNLVVATAWTLVRLVFPGDVGYRELPAVGEVWWADVPFEEVDESKDRPCLVIRSSAEGCTVLMLTSQDKSARTGYVPVAAPRAEQRDPGKLISYLKLDRRIELTHSAFRRKAEWSVDAVVRQAVEQAHPGTFVAHRPLAA